MDEVELKQQIESKNPGFSVYAFKNLGGNSDYPNLYVIEMPKKSSSQVYRARLFKLVESSGDREWEISSEDILYSVGIAGAEGGHSEYKDIMIIEDTPLPDDVFINIYGFLSDIDFLSQELEAYDGESSSVSSAIKTGRISSIGIFRPKVNSPNVGYRIHVVSELGSYLVYFSSNGKKYEINNVELVDR